METDRFEQITIGDEAEIFHVVTEKDVDSFVKLTGDDNPLHVDATYAETTSFKKPVVHGMLTASFISTIIGTKLPGKGSLWYEQSLRFLEPVRIGEKIRVWVKVKHKSPSQRILVLDTIVSGDGDRRVIEGEAKVKVLLPETKKKVNVMTDDKRGAVIVTGASRGIGAAIAIELGSAGYPVVVNYLNRDKNAENIVQAIRNKKGKATACKADVSDAEAVRMMVDMALSEFGAVSGIVNNASASIESVKFSDLSWDSFQKHIDVQIKGAFYLSQAVLPHLVQNQKGIIVNIASVVADNTPPTKWVPYNVVKAALITFSRSLAVEYGAKGIRVNCVSPGMTQTDLIANIPDKAKMLTKMQTPLRRLAVPEDIASAVAFLFSDKAAFISGQNIRVCGGIVMM
ncbi:MAG: glucose 1-dehydrogenase [Deltaproteobacteria bacterium]|nr:glucose 1-dehydrogenase [Deltaproteobacteria bacterium]